jgi:hypothetical protein
MISDPRIAILADVVGPPPTTSEGAANSLTIAADALADLSPDLSPGEAKLLLEALTHTWTCPPAQNSLVTVGNWSSGQSRRRASLSREGGDELETHLADQITGRYQCAPWPWPILTTSSRSLLPGSVTVLCGTPGAAKSWFVLSCLSWWTANNTPAAVLMLEETRKWHLNRLLAQCEGNASILDPAWCKANGDLAMAAYQRHKLHIDAVRERLTCDSDMSMAKCAEWVEQQCDRRQRVIVVDPITLADSAGQKPWDADRSFMIRCKTAINKTGASLVLVTHPRKANGQTKGPAGLDDLAGGAAYGRACASALWLTSGDDAHVRVVDDAGRLSDAVAHKILRIIKARNSPCGGASIAYAFRGLAFDELGTIQRTQETAEANKTHAQLRAAKMRNKPEKGEDLF